VNMLNCFGNIKIGFKHFGNIFRDIEKIALRNNLFDVNLKKREVGN